MPGVKHVSAILKKTRQTSYSAETKMAVPVMIQTSC